MSKKNLMAIYDVISRENTGSVYFDNDDNMRFSIPAHNDGSDNIEVVPEDGECEIPYLIHRLNTAIGILMDAVSVFTKKGVREDRAHVINVLTDNINAASEKVRSWCDAGATDSSCPSCGLNDCGCERTTGVGCDIGNLQMIHIPLAGGIGEES